MIKNFLVINCTGKNNDSLALKFNNEFIIENIPKKINKNEQLVNNILAFLKKNKAELNKEFSVIVNQGPGSFSSIRVSISVAIGIKISMKTKLFGYSNKQMNELSLENIEFLIDKNKLENKLIKPIYIS